VPEVRPKKASDIDVSASMHRMNALLNRLLLFVDNEVFLACNGAMQIRIIKTVAEVAGRSRSRCGHLEQQAIEAVRKIALRIVTYV